MVPYKAKVKYVNIVCFHWSMSGEAPGSLELHTYNSNAKIHVLIQILPIQPKFGILCQFGGQGISN